MKDYKKLPIGIIGGGRVGAPLARALQNASYNINSISGNSDDSKKRIKKLLPKVEIKTIHEVASENNILFLTVPDDKLESLISDLENSGCFSKDQFVLHTSGSTGLQVFNNVKTKIKPIAFHPAMTFTGSRYDVRRLVSSTYGITVPNFDSRTVEMKLVKSIVKDLSGTPVFLTEEQRMLYHAGLTHGSNYLVTLVTEAFEMLEKAGLEDPEAILNPLLKAALGNVLFKRGEALSGPISRGDTHVVEKHLKVIQTEIPHLLDTYKQLGQDTVKIARYTNRINENEEKDLNALMQ